MNWLYAGKSGAADEYLVNGKRIHGRSARAMRENKKTRRAGENTLDWLQRCVDPKATKVTGSSKHRYLYPLDKNMRRQVAKLAKPYPKRAVEGLKVSHDATGFEV